MFGTQAPPPVTTWIPFHRLMLVLIIAATLTVNHIVVWCGSNWRVSLERDHVRYMRQMELTTQPSIEKK